LKIALDPWVLSRRLRHQGTYVYTQNLIRQFRTIASVDPEVSFCVFACPAAANDANMIEEGRGFERSDSALLANEYLWRLGAVNWAAARVGANLLFSPTLNILPPSKIPVVSTIHDVTPVVMPSHSAVLTAIQRSELWWAVRFSRAIITDSECSKRDLIEIYGLPDAKVSVVHLGYDKAIFNAERGDPAERGAVLNRLGIQGPYIVHHGTIQPRKNLERLIAAYRLLRSRNRNLELDLVLAGSPGWDCRAVFQAAERPGGGRIHFPGALNDADLAVLVKGAALAVIPSLYEGFCLPMIESMACGTPTIASSTSCLGEISGGKLLYFDPLSVEDMANSMERALECGDIRQALIDQGRERASEFDWAKCARQTLEILKRHARNGYN
jgi:glycosyltransferase involved in cell wall biosynthesis